MPKTKFFHSSPTRYKPGDVIVGKSRWLSSRVPVVFMTTSPVPHYTIIGEATKKNWFVYRVVPTTKVKLGTLWDEYMAASVEVVQCMGPARQWAKRKKHGSRVYWKWMKSEILQNTKKGNKK
jgi:hypothetical protein